MPRITSPMPANRRTAPPRTDGEARSSSVSKAPSSRRSRGSDAPGSDAKASSRSSNGPLFDRLNSLRTNAAALQKRLQVVTGVLVVAAASVLVAWGLSRYLHRSPRFAIATIAVEGLQRLSPQRIERSGGIATGANIFAVDQDEVRSRLLEDPWIESATIRRKLPDELHVRIVERDPRFVVVLGDRMFLADSKANLFKPVEPGDPVDFPVLTGLAAPDLERDREGVTRKVRQAVELLGELERVAIAERMPPQEFHLDEVGNLTVVVGTDGVSLAFGEPPYRTKVEKALTVFAQLQARKAAAEAVFLDNQAHPERVVVRMRTTDAPRKTAKNDREEP